MKIPAKYQVFDGLVVIDSKDEQRLSVHLSGYVPLMKALAGVNEPDLKRLVIMELNGKQRWKLIDRLLMRLGRVQRKRFEQKIRQCLPQKSKKAKSRRK